MKNNFTLLLLSLFLTAFCFSCGDNNDDGTDGMKSEALVQYSKIVRATYEDSYNTALTLKQTIDAFVAAPSDAGFQACKTAWLNCRKPYNQTDAFRFYGGPIDDADGPEGFLNAWPLDELFLDYVQGDANAGIINSTTTPITKQNIIAIMEISGETAVFTGYHAIEFLLWGQDFNAGSPGMRPFTDYVTGGGGTAANQDRRGQYLKVVVDLLLENLAQVRDEWAPNATYTQDFLNTRPDKEAMGLVFTGLKEFTKAELAGERMAVAVNLQDQEHEHSCFSDDTTNDLKFNLKGVRNVYFGTYTRVDGSVVSGTSFDQIAEILDPAKAAAVRAAFADAEAKVNGIPAPFDQTILNNPDIVTQATIALDTLSDRLVEIAGVLGAEF